MYNMYDQILFESWALAWSGQIIINVLKADEVGSSDGASGECLEGLWFESQPYPE
jgi:hypothetical protein